VCLVYVAPIQMMETWRVYVTHLVIKEQGQVFSLFPSEVKIQVARDGSRVCRSTKEERTKLLTPAASAFTYSAQVRRRITESRNHRLEKTSKIIKSNRHLHGYSTMS